MTTQTYVNKVMRLPFNILSKFVMGFMVAQMVKNPPAMRETWAQSLDWGDLLKDGVTTQSSILAWSIPMERISSKEQVSFNVAVATTCSDFGAKENKICHSFHSFPIYFR